MKGSIYAIYDRPKGGRWLVQIAFGDGQEFSDMLEFVDSADHWKPYVPSEGEISLIPPVPNGRRDGCPSHGKGHLKWDNEGRGWYCAKREAGGFCGRQSWAQWHKSGQ